MSRSWWHFQEQIGKAKSESNLSFPVCTDTGFKPLSDLELWFWKYFKGNIFCKDNFLLLQIIICKRNLLQDQMRTFHFFGEDFQEHRTEGEGFFYFFFLSCLNYFNFTKVVDVAQALILGIWGKQSNLWKTLFPLWTPEFKHIWGNNKYYYTRRFDTQFPQQRSLPVVFELFHC